MNLFYLITLIAIFLNPFAHENQYQNDFLKAYYHFLPQLYEARERFTYIMREIDSISGLTRQERSQLLAERYGSETDSIKPLAEVYSWAIPNEAALQTLAKYAPLVEIGAGSGYWASLLRKRGVDIIAYDDGSWPFRHYWFNVLRGDEWSVVRHSDRALFLCWPPPKVPMASHTLKNFHGKYVIYVGEDRGGVTGDDAFFDHLERDFQVIERVDIPRWPGYSDDLVVFERLPVY